MYRRFGILLAAIAVTWLASAADSKKKKKEEEEEPRTQTLPLLPEPPMAVTAETSRLVFDTAPLSEKGLLSRQTRDGLRQLLRSRRGGTIIKIRAFVAGTGDVRRVQSLVSEMFSEKHLPVPAVSTVRIGALPLDGAQVALESVIAAKKPVNPNGLAFISGQRGETIEESVNGILGVVKALGPNGGQVVKATCFLSSISGADDARSRLAAAFPGAALNIVQMQRLPVEPKVSCEAVAALESPSQAPVRLIDGGASSPEQPHAAVVAARRVVLTGMQLGFRAQEADLRLAFERLGKALESQHAGFRDVVLSRVYAMSQPIAENVRKVQLEYVNREQPPAQTYLLPDSLPAIDASFGLEVIAALAR